MTVILLVYGETGQNISTQKGSFGFQMSPFYMKK
jgi:hypothetical protein